MHKITGTGNKVMDKFERDVKKNVHKLRVNQARAFGNQGL